MSDTPEPHKPQATEQLSAADLFKTPCDQSLSSQAGLGSYSQKDISEVKSSVATSSMPADFPNLSVTNSSPNKTASSAEVFRAAEDKKISSTDIFQAAEKKISIDNNGNVTYGPGHDGAVYDPAFKPLDSIQQYLNNHPEFLLNLHPLIGNSNYGKLDRNLADQKLHETTDKNPLISLFSGEERNMLSKMQDSISQGNIDGLKEQFKKCPADKLDEMVGELNRSLAENKANVKLSFTHNGNVTLRSDEQHQALEINPSTGETIVRGVHKLPDGSTELSGEVMDKTPKGVMTAISNEGVRNINKFHNNREENILDLIKSDNSIIPPERPNNMWQDGVNGINGNLKPRSADFMSKGIEFPDKKIGEHNVDFAIGKLKHTVSFKQLSNQFNPDTPVLNKLQESIANGKLDDIKAHLNQCPPHKLKDTLSVLNDQLSENKAHLQLTLTPEGKVNISHIRQSQSVEIDPKTKEAKVIGESNRANGSKDPKVIMSNMSNDTVREINKASDKLIYRDHLE